MEDYIMNTILTLGIATIGYFLKNIHTSVNEMSKSISSLNDRLIRHETANESSLKRIDRLEQKLDNSESMLNSIFRDYELHKIKKQ
jgi:hypothetical protein